MGEWKEEREEQDGQNLPPVGKRSGINLKGLAPAVAGVNKTLITAVFAVFGVILFYCMYEFFFYVPAAKEEAVKFDNSANAKKSEDGPATYSDLGKLSPPKPKIEEKAPELPPAPSSPPSAQIPVPATQSPQTYSSPLAFNIGAGVASAVSGGVGDLPSQEENARTRRGSFRADVRGNKDFYNPARITEPLSPYEIKAGSVIPSTLISGINSDLPGVIIGQIGQNVYDSVSGRYLLLPQGTKLIGEYNSEIVYGQSRVQVYWTRLIMPNGDSFDLNAATGADMEGYSGLTGRVNNHTNKLINGALATSAFTIIVSSQTNSISDRNTDPATVVAENLTDIAGKIVDRNMQIQPTIEVKPGARFNVLVDQDLVLRPYQGL
jgi:type IV secretory pathway VirB10-like protein